MKKFIFIALATLILIPTAFAASFNSGDEVIINDVINDDAYVAGGSVHINNDINGDLFVVGGEILFNTKVSQDLTVGGGNITVNGEIGDDMRVGAGNVTIRATIKDDLIVGGGNVNLYNDSFIGGDLTFGSGNIFLNGKVNGDVTGAGETVNINGEVLGNVKLYGVSEVKISQNAKIRGDFEYSSSNEVPIEDGIIEGEIIFNKIETVATTKDTKWMAFNIISGFSIFSFLSVLVLGLVILLVAKYFSINVSKTAYKSPLKSLGIGFITVVTVPIAFIILLFTVIGIPFAFIALLTWIILLCTGKAFASMLIGWKIVKVKDRSSFKRLYGGFALGALIISILVLIPIAGWIVKFIMVLIALGAVVMTFSKLYKSLNKKNLA